MFSGIHQVSLLSLRSDMVGKYFFSGISEAPYDFHKGDPVPKTAAGRSIFVGWALCGVGTMTILISRK